MKGEDLFLLCLMTASIRSHKAATKSCVFPSKCQAHSFFTCKITLLHLHIIFRQCSVFAEKKGNLAEAQLSYHLG